MAELAFVEDLTIYHAAAQKEQLLAALQALPPGECLTLNLSGVAEIDTSGVQLLLMAARDAAREGRQAKVGAASPAVGDVLKFLNLAEQLES